jgi:uncharacterized protein YjbJ (UPF0337 family)
MNMEIFAGLAIGLVVALIAVIVVLRGKPKAVPVEPVVAPQPTLTAAEIREVIREVHSETLSSIADQSKRDREEVVSLATREMGKAIDGTKDQIDGKVRDLEVEIQKLREMNTEKFGSMDNAVAGLAQQTQALNKGYLVLRHVATGAKRCLKICS